LQALTAASRPAESPSAESARLDAPTRPTGRAPPTVGRAAASAADPPSGATETAECYALGPYRLDAKARLLLRGSDPVPLGERAVAVLLLLVEQAGRLVRKEHLIDIAWNGMAVEESNLTVQIAALRRVLDAVPGGRNWIETLPRRGYRFVGPVTVGPVTVGPVTVGPVTVGAIPGRAAASPPRRRGPVALAVVAAIAVLAILALAAMPGIFAMEKPALTVLPFRNLGAGAEADAMAMAVTERLAGGMSRIRNIRTVEAGANAAATPDGADLKAIARDSGARFFVIGTLLPSPGKWEIQARLIDVGDGNTEWAGGFVAAGDAADPARAINQLVGLVGDPLAARISGLLNEDTAAGPSADEVQSLVNQARQFTEQNARDRSLAAEELFQRALALDPSNVDAEIHFARTEISAFLNGWYDAAEGERKMAEAARMLRAALKAKPTYLPALDANCIYMRAVDRFLDALPACDAVLAIDPWSVRAIKEIGINQMILGRFEEALASFERADQLDALHGIRWTWLEGAGLASLLLDRNEAAVSWLTRSLEAAPGTGRSFALLAVADERLGRQGDARTALANFRERQPNATLRSMFPPQRKGNPRYVEAMQNLRPALAAVGLPP
jgi:DNA-binding winged helix-turn-helix (wHTH) protein/TolB-like protein/tetratricopeptide (TPR) repeat protein